MSLSATIFDIQRGSYVDGPGIRTTVFMKGCNLDCAWCHNPESQNAKPQRMFYKNKCVLCGKCVTVCPSGALTFDNSPVLNPEKCTLCGKCALWCPADAISVCGKTMDTETVFREVRKDKAFYETSGGGVTVSGGECMLYPDFVAELLDKCKKDGIGTAVDTAGNVPFESLEKVIPFTDIFLYDIKCVTPEAHKKFTGIVNNRILDNYKLLISLGKRVIVRVPMTTECSANDEEFPKIAAFLNEYKPEKVELLPYHALGENKYRAIGREPEIFHAPSKEDMERFKGMIRE